MANLEALRSNRKVWDFKTKFVPIFFQKSLFCTELVVSEGFTAAKGGDWSEKFSAVNSPF